MLEKSAEISKYAAVWARRLWSVVTHRRAVAIVGGLLLLASEPQIVQASVPSHVTGAIGTAHQHRLGPRVFKVIRWHGSRPNPNAGRPFPNGRTMSPAMGMPQSLAAFSQQLEAAIQKASERYGVPPSTLRAFAAIESGGNPRASNGRYHGVYQLSVSVFQKYGGRGNIFDLNENTDVAARKLRSESDAFSQQFGRAPTATELYMIHQQGVGGAAMHMASPDVPAWQNMHRTGEGQQKGPGWARLAIWGNVPADQRARFPGGVNNITSRQFMDMWARKMEKFGGGEGERSADATVF